MFDRLFSENKPIRAILRAVATVFSVVLVTSIAPAHGQGSNVQTSKSQAKAKLGIALKPGYRSPYIAHIDPNGLAAASGFHKSDYIVEIGNVSIYNIDQAKRFLNAFKAGTIFKVLVKRNDTLHLITVDPNRQGKIWPKEGGTDALSTCFVVPTEDCIDDALETILAANETDYYTWSDATRNYDTLGWVEFRDSAFTHLRLLYFRLPSNQVWLKFPSMMDLQKDLGLKPDQSLIGFTEKAMLKKKGPEDIGRLLDLAAGFSEVSGEMGIPYLKRAIALIEKNPKIYNANARELGKAIGYSGQIQMVEKVLGLKEFGREEANELIQSIIRTRHQVGDRRNAVAIQKVLINAKQSWTNQDILSFVEFAQEVHDLELSRTMIARLEKQFEEGSELVKGLVLYSLIKAHGVSGNIHKARQLIDEHVNNPLIAMMDLTIAAGKSRSTIGGSVQFYKDFPKLLADTHALVKTASDEELKMVRQIRFAQFYQVLAASVKTSVTVAELSRLKLEKNQYEQVIDQQVEVRKFDQALALADAVNSKFGSTWAYRNIADSLSSAGSDQQLLAYTKHPSFQKYKNRSALEYIERLYWSGRIESALTVFNSLDDQQKAKAIVRQTPFVAGCPRCDL